ncbi:MAG: ThiF family adenylyltransferase [Chloroflexi bacterium]|nr:ThiF family adenylyltransferase [Chloroflexota bacterium]
MAEQPIALTPEQVKRYSRHIIMSDVGSKGQRALMASKALIIGAGGLGSPSAIYLSLAGVGTVGIVDFDVVELSNLQRQVLFNEDDIAANLPKAEAAARKLRRINSDIPSYEALRLPPIYKDLVEKTFDGLILVGGVTGCGKSTTLAAMLEHVNVNRSLRA